ITRTGEFGEHLHGHDLRALRHTGERGARARAVARGNPRDVRAMPTPGDRTAHCRTGADLLTLTVRTHGRAPRRGRRVARLLDDFACQERVRRLDTSIHD